MSKPGDRKMIHQLDLTFHKKIAEIANNPFLQQIVGSLYDALNDVLQVAPQTLKAGAGTTMLLWKSAIMNPCGLPRPCEPWSTPQVHACCRL